MAKHAGIFALIPTLTTLLIEMAKENPREQSITIKFSHLNQKLREIIGTSNPKDIATEFATGHFGTLRANRRLRAWSEAFTLINAFNLVQWSTIGSHGSASRQFQGIAATGTALSVLSRTMAARAVQKKHRELAAAMKEFGIMQTKFEGDYPRDWINPTIVAKTHPTFYVKANGDVVFPSQTRIEYARYVFQKKFPGKIGLNPWRWRAYLEKPKAPAKVADIVSAKIGEWLALAKRRPAFGIVSTSLHATARKAPARRRL